MNPNQPAPSAATFNAGVVTDPNQSEVQRQGLFDSLLYPTAGTLQLSFFNQPPGSGVTTAPGAVAGTAKTAFDTNIQVQNSLPSGKAFQPHMIEIFVWPGSSAAANTFVLANPAIFNATAALAVAEQVSDVYAIENSGRLQLGILDKTYVDETPLLMFPQQSGLSGDFAVGTAGTNAQPNEVGIVLIRCIGRAYKIGIPMTFSATQNFFVNLLWAGLVATPSGFNARIMVRLDGYFIRATQ